MNEWEWDKEGTELVEKIVRLVLPSLNEGLKDALEEVLTKVRFFVDFNSFVRYLFDTLEDKISLPPEVKTKLTEEIQSIYEKTKAELTVDKSLDLPDKRTIDYATKLTDFYLGKFFQGDRQLRLRAISWMSKYYLEKGNPIGKGQEGAKAFLEEFGKWLKPQTEWKVRQIVDTSVNYLRNSARLRAFQRALIKYYRWDAVGDRLTCPACRSMDGRVFRTEDAVRVLDTIESSEDPTIVKELRPIITTQVRGPSAQILTKWPPLHPHCYDRETDVFTNEGWKKFAELNGTELFLSFNPQNPRELAFVPAVNFISYHYKGKMIRFYNRQLDLCVTPEHQMIIYSRGGKKRLPKGYHFKVARNLKTGTYGIPLNPVEATEGFSKVVFCGIEFNAMEFARLMGYYLSEGSCSLNPEGRWVVKIAQSDEKKKLKIVSDLESLKNKGIKIWIGKECIYLKVPTQLAEGLKALGVASKKHVPEELKHLQPDALREFLKCYILGDGHVKKGRVWKGYMFSGDTILFTSSNRLASDIAEIALRAGFSVSYYLNKTKGKVVTFRNGQYVINSDLWVIRLKKSKASYSFKIELVDYDDFVFCVELQKWHTLFIRRKGKTCWSGNCRCRIVTEEETVELPVTVERPPFAKDTSEQRELEEWYKALMPKEIENRIKAHLGSDWLRPVKGEKGVNAYKRAKNNLDQHFRKHGQEFGYKTAEEYKKGAYEVIKNPDEVYVEKSKGKTFYIFRKGNAVVISNDDNLAIVSYYKLHRSFEERLKGGKRDGLIKIY